MECKTCLFDDDFWNKESLDDKEKKLVVRLYYSYSLDFMCFNKTLKLCSPSPCDVAAKVLNIINEFSCQQLIQIISEDFQSYEITPNGIPQFSNLDDCFTGVVDAIMDSDLKDISFEKMGYLLRISPRNDVADKKYGENHAKTASLLGLAEIAKKGNTMRINISPIGEVYYALSKECQEQLKPKLVLYSKMMQNYFAQESQEKVLKDMMSILKESTQKRRNPNVQAFIKLVNDAIDEEIYGNRH